MYKKRAVLMDVPRSNEKAISEVLFAVKKAWHYRWMRVKVKTLA
jgi:hypothetical protein